MYQIGVGKTSIISCFTKGKFSNNTQVTTSAAFSSRKINYHYLQQTVNFEIWDTCGQEKYRSLTQLFYKDAYIAIMVYDITNKKSYKEAINYWYYQIKDKGMKDVVMVLCGNKADLYEEEAVSEEDAREWARLRKIEFYSVSAKDRETLTEMFQKIGENALKVKGNGDLSHRGSMYSVSKSRKGTVRLGGRHDGADGDDEDKDGNVDKSNCC